MTRPSLIAGLLALFATAGPLSAADWPQWRGPQRTGVSMEGGWSSQGREENLWSRSVGLGYSSVAVSGGRLYTKGWNEERGEDIVYCLDSRTGAEIWTMAYGADKWDKYHGGGTNSTPSIDGDRVHVFDREGRFHCLAAADGTVVWKKDLPKEYQVDLPTWGFAASPLVLDDMVVINAGRVIALKKESGETIWVSEDSGHAYSTPVDFTPHGRPCLAVFNGQGLVILDRSSGKTIATHPWKTSYEINAATPVIVGSNIFISSGYQHGCALIEVGRSGGAPKVLWENKSMRNKMSGCVLWADHLYGFDEGMLKCLDLEGDEKWSERGLGMGALMIADGRLIVMSEKGELIIAKATPESFQEQSRVKVLSGGVYWTTPVLADGLIYCRNSKGDLACRDHRPQPAGP